jgi:hypothetical protein
MESDADSTLSKDLVSAFSMKDVAYVDAKKDVLVTCTEAFRTAWFLTRDRSSQPLTLRDVSRVGIVTYGKNTAKRDGHARICRIILKANGIEPGTGVTYVEVPWTNVTDVLNGNGVDAIFVCCNEEEFKDVRKDKRVTSIDYGANMQLEIVGTFAPYARTQTVYTTDWFINSVFSKYDKIRTVIVLDTVLTCGAPCQTTIPLVTQAIRRFRHAVNNTLRASRFFKVHNVTEQVLSGLSEFVPGSADPKPTVDVMNGDIRVSDLTGYWKRSRWQVYDQFVAKNLDTPWQLQLGSSVIKMPENVPMYVLPGNVLATSVPLLTTPDTMKWSSMYLATRDGSGAVVTLEKHESTLSLEI